MAAMATVRAASARARPCGGRTRCHAPPGADRTEWPPAAGRARRRPLLLRVSGGAPGGGRGRAGRRAGRRSPPPRARPHPGPDLRDPGGGRTHHPRPRPPERPRAPPGPAARGVVRGRTGARPPRCAGAPRRPRGCARPVPRPDAAASAAPPSPLPPPGDAARGLAERRATVPRSEGGQRVVKGHGARAIQLLQRQSHGRARGHAAGRGVLEHARRGRRSQNPEERPQLAQRPPGGRVVAPRGRAPDSDRRSAARFAAALSTPNSPRAAQAMAAVASRAMRRRRPSLS